MPRGHCTLLPDDTGRILDRLAGLEQVIPPEAVRQALQDTGRINPRSCKLTHQVVCWVVLAMGLLTDLPIRQVFKHARRLRVGEETPDRSSLCVARRRLGIAPMRHLFEHVVRPLARPETPGAFYRGLRLMGIDGTVLDVPDSDANAAAFGRPSAGPRGDGAFPQVRKLSLVELGTHVEVAFVARSIAHGEQSMVGALLRHLGPDMLLLWDRGFFSYALWKEVTARRVKILARVTSRLILEPIRDLADGSYLARIYPTPEDRRKDRDGIIVRVIRYTLDDPRRVGHGEVHILITNLFDEDLYPAEELIILYHERWEQELVYDEQKTHQDPRRATKPAHLRSGTPAGVMQEILRVVAGPLRGPGADVRGGIGGRAGHRSVVVHRLFPDPQVPAAGMRQLDARAIRAVVPGAAVGDAAGADRRRGRRNRINPRVVKRKMSKFKKKRPEHRHLPPLEKTFAETVVMLR